MDNIELETVISDLGYAISNICLGSIESIVLDSAVEALIHSWNDHNENKINESDELKNWGIWKLQ